MNRSTEKLVPSMPQRLQDRLSTSTTATTMEMGEATTWEPPPVPPIPPDAGEESWKGRSNKRYSYTSQTSGRSAYTAPQSLGAGSEKRMTRPVSEVSSTFTALPLAAKRSSRATITRRGLGAHADVNWENEALNPHNWRSRRRWFHTWTALAVAFSITLASSIIAPAQHDFEAKFGIPPATATLPFALFVLGLACGPFINAPCNEGFGRRVTYTTCFILFAVFTLAAGLVQTSYGLIICRLLAGIFASPILVAGYAILSDIWKPDERTLPLTVYSTTVLTGPTIGLLVGGFVTQHKSGQWTQYVVLFAVAACGLPLLFFSETSKATILGRKRGESKWAPVTESSVIDALLGPLHMLFMEPAVFLLSLYSSFNLAVMYACLAAFAGVFFQKYAFHLGSQGLTFLSMVIGLTLALVFLLLNHIFLHSPRVEKWQRQKAAEAEKAAWMRPRTNGSSHYSAVSNFSRPTYTRDASRTSLAMSMKRITSGTTTPPATARERKVTLAVAAADYLNSLSVNEGRRILPERIQLLLNRNPPFGDLCTALEGYQLRLDRVQFAKVLVDALPAAGAANPQQSALVRSKSLHRSAAAAALDATTPAASPPDDSWPLPVAPRQRSTYKEPPMLQRPPERWRLLPILPASILLVISLFMFGWTARSSISWVAPCFAMGILAFSVMLTLVSTQLYIIDRYGVKDGLNALAGGISLAYLLSFVFVMFAEPMFDGLGTGWAASLFGFVALVLGTAPWYFSLHNGRRS